MARVLILRQRTDALDTAASLRARGHAPLLLPVEEARPLDAPPPGPFSGFIVTSANAVPPLARHRPGDRRPVLAVGERTACALRVAGFGSVSAGPGFGAGLAAAAAGLAGRSGAPLLYVAGRVRSPALEAALAAAGVPFRVWEAYAMEALDPDAAAIEAAVGDAPPDAVLLLSVGQVEAYGRLLGLRARPFEPPPRLLCLSRRIYAALPPELRPDGEISPRPTLAALLERFL